MVRNIHVRLKNSNLVYKWNVSDHETRFYDGEAVVVTIGGHVRHADSGEPIYGTSIGTEHPRWNPEWMSAYETAMGSRK